MTWQSSGDDDDDDDGWSASESQQTQRPSEGPFGSLVDPQTLPLLQMLFHLLR